jgi:hypothetical protein
MASYPKIYQEHCPQKSPHACPLLKRKIKEREAIGRVGTYNSRFFQLGSERYPVLDLKRDGFLR